VQKETKSLPERFRPIVLNYPQNAFARDPLAAWLGGGNICVGGRKGAGSWEGWSMGQKGAEKKEKGKGKGKKGKGGTHN